MSKIHFRIEPIRLTTLATVALSLVALLTVLITSIKTIVQINRPINSQPANIITQQQNITAAIKLLTEQTIQIDKGN